MKPAPFSVSRPRTVDSAVALLASQEGLAVPLSGGQSLMPLLNARILRPELVVDLNRIDELAGFEPTRDRIVFRGLCRHSVLVGHPALRALLPILSEAMRFVGSPATRSRGTVGGSLAHADPSAELPAIALLLGASVGVATRGGQLDVSVDDYLASWVRREPHIVTAMEVNLPQGPWSWGFSEISRGFGTGNAAVCGVILEHRAGSVRKASVVLAGARLRARHLPDVETRLAGLRIDGSLPYDAFRAAVAGVPIVDDPLRGTATYLRSAMETVLIEAVQSAQARLAA